MLAFAILAALVPVPQGSTQCVVGAGTEVSAAASSTDDWFGMDVDLSGNTLVVGSDWGAEMGTAFVFERDPSGSWVEVKQLFASDATPGARFGWTVAIAGDTIVAGAQQDSQLSYHSGAAYVFARDHGGPDNWGEVVKLLGAGPTNTRVMGIDVEIDGSTILVGRGPGTSPAVEVYEPDGPTWSLTATIPSPTSFSGFGRALSLDGDTAAVGAYYLVTGTAYLYERDLGGPGQWGLRTQLFPSAGQNDADFGISVSVLGGRLVVGASGEDTQTGSAYVYERDQGGPGAWGETQRLRHDQPTAQDRFGYSVALRPDSILVGARAQGAQDAGAGYKFHLEAGTWTQTYKLKPSLGPYDWFGWRVAADGPHEVVAAPHAKGPVQDSGKVVVYAAPPPTHVAYCTSGATAAGCVPQVCTYGVASASAPLDFVVMGHSLPSSSDGIFFFGANGRQAVPWGNGTAFRCVVPPVSRGPLLGGSGSGTCNGRLELDVNALWTAKPSKNPGAGALVQGQFWFRDPLNTSNQTTSLSHGIEFAVAP